MSFSEFGSYVRQDFAALTDADMPVDALTARLMVNNAQHAFDESAQTLCSWADSTLSTATYTVGTRWTPLALLGPFPARLRPSSGFYKYRVQLSIARTGSNPVDFRVSIGRLATALNHVSQVTTLPTVFGASVNTTTVTTVTPTNAIMEIPDEFVPSAYAPITTKDGAANITAAGAPCVWVVVAARSPSGNQVARLAGLYVAEYVGTP